eukprot:995883-Pleurochrysis_carterae.AAC.2
MRVAYARASLYALAWHRCGRVPTWAHACACACARRALMRALVRARARAHIASVRGADGARTRLRGARWVQGDQVLHDHELLGDDGLELGGARVEDSAAACLVQLLQRVRDGDQLGYGEALVLAAVREREEAIRLTRQRDNCSNQRESKSFESA